MFCPHCGRPADSFLATTCDYCGSALTGVVSNKAIDVGRRITVRDLIITLLFAAVLITANISLGGMTPGSNFSILLVYALLMGYRLRRPLLAGLLPLILAFVVILTNPDTYGRMQDVISNSYAFIEFLFVMVFLQALFIAGIGLLTGLFTGRLCRPLPFAVLERRFSSLMVPEAFKEFKFREKAEHILNPDSHAPDQIEDKPPATAGWLNGPERLKIVEGLLSALRKIKVPRLGVTEEEIENGRATRVFCNSRCPICHGKGVVKCPDCSDQQDSMEPETDFFFEQPSCATCGGSKQVKCECVESVTYTIPRNAPNGYFVQGYCENPNSKHYARIHSLSLRRPPKPALVMFVCLVGLLSGWLFSFLSFAEVFETPHLGDRIVMLLLGLGSLSCFVGSIYLLSKFGARIGWHLMRFGLFLVAAFLMFYFLATPSGFFSILHSGLTPGWIVVAILFAMSVFTVIIILQYWHSAQIRAYADLSGDILTVVGPMLLPARDRLFALFRSKFVRGFASAIVIVLIGGGLLDSLPNPSWYMLRGRVAEVSRNYDGALVFYKDALKKARTDVEKENIQAASQRVMVRELEDGVHCLKEGEIKHFYLNKLIDLSEELGEQHLTLNEDLKPRVPGLMLSLADGLLSQKNWDKSREVLSTLVDSFEDSEAAVEASSRSDWHFVRVIKTVTKDKVAVEPYEDGNTVAHDYYTPSDGYTIVIVLAELAYIGKTQRDLPARIITLADDENCSYKAMGIQEEHKFRTYSSAGFGLKFPNYHTAYYLFPIGRFDGKALGPSLYEASIVFEVPSDERQFSMKINGEPVTRITVS